MAKLTKFLSLMLVLCMLVSIFASCNDKDKKNEQPNDTDNSTDNTNPDGTSPDNKPDSQPPADTTEYLSFKELCDELSASVWKTDRLLGNDKAYGLTNPSNVGIDKDRFENEVLYPVPADSEFAKIFNVTEYGVSTENDDNSAAINSIIEEAKSVEGLKKIYFPKGVYKIASSINFNEVKDLYFCGDEAEFLCTKWFHLFTMTDCNNLHFNGLRVDCDPSPVVSATAISYDPTTRVGVYKIDDEFDLSKYDQWYAEGAHYIYSYMEHEYDELTGLYYPTGYGNVLLGDPYWAQLAGFSYDHEKREMTINFKSGVKDVAVGTRVSLALSNKKGLCFYGTRNDYMYFEDIEVYCISSMVFYCNYGSNYFCNDTNVMFREGSSRMMTATSDSFHFGNVAGEIKITNSTVQGSLDDCLNVKTMYREVKSVNGNVLVSDKAESSGKQTFFDVGDTIEIFDKSDLSSLGTFTITDLTYEDRTWTLTLDKPVEESVVGHFFANDTKSTKLTVENNIFGNKRNRGFLIQCRDVTITNNVFANFVHTPIIIHSVCDVYAEGMVPKNVTIKNNKFINNYDFDITIQSWGTQKSSPGVITGVVIENNFFAQSHYCPINSKTAGSSTIKNNMFYEICLSEDNRDISSDLYRAIAISICEDMKVSGNLLYTNTQNKRFKVTGSGSMYTENSKNIYKYGE